MRTLREGRARPSGQSRAACERERSDVQIAMRLAGHSSASTHMRYVLFTEQLSSPEQWRGGKCSARVASLLEACVVEPLFQDLAPIAGEAIAPYPSGPRCRSIGRRAA